MAYLTKVKNVPHGENGVSRSYSGHKHYWLCESKYNIRLLNEYRKSHIGEK
jgi:hypothetical protein